MSEKSEKDKKAFQSYLGNIKAKTGKTPEDFRKLAKKKGLVKAREVVAWLKEEYGLGYGHAGATGYRHQTQGRRANRTVSSCRKVE